MIEKNNNKDTKQNNLLIADDDITLCESLKDYIEQNFTFDNIYIANNPLQLERTLSTQIVELCLLDLMYEGYGMLDPLGLSARYPNTKFIVISGYLESVKPPNLLFFAAKPFDMLYLSKLIDLSLNSSNSISTIGNKLVH